MSDAVTRSANSKRSFLSSSAAVYAVEPFRRNYTRLCDSIALDHATNDIPLHMGLAGIGQVSTLYVRDQRVGASGSQIGSNVDEHGCEYEVLAEEHVLALPLDVFIEVAGARVPNHIKIDVDGIERQIVNGMKKTLQRREIRSVLVEVNQDTTNGEELQRIFRDVGFSRDQEFDSLPNHSRDRGRHAFGALRAHDLHAVRLRSDPEQGTIHDA